MESRARRPPMHTTRYVDVDPDQLEYAMGRCTLYERRTPHVCMYVSMSCTVVLYSFFTVVLFTYFCNLLQETRT